VPYRLWAVANVRTPRRAWVDAGLQALAAGGPDAVRVEALAVALGVSKGGFYWHFTDRQALLEEVLDAWEKAATGDIVARVDSQPADPRAKLQQLFDLTSSTEGLAIEWAVRDWSRRDQEVAERLRQVDDRRLRYLRSLFRPLCADEDDVTARALLAYSLFLSSDLVAAQHGERTHQVLQLAVDRLLSASWD
jgi:AcrR family transcriptional regulator